MLIQLLKHLFFILIFIACNFLSSSNSYGSSTFVGDSGEELNPIISGLFLLDEEFADETEDNEFSKHLMLFASDYIHIQKKYKENSPILYNLVINKTVLLNSYIDLPPPGIS